MIKAMLKYTRERSNVMKREQLLYNKIINFSQGTKAEGR